jgi:hypothetical protein
MVLVLRACFFGLIHISGGWLRISCSKTGSRQNSQNRTPGSFFVVLPEGQVKRPVLPGQAGNRTRRRNVIAGQ